MPQSYQAGHSKKHKRPSEKLGLLCAKSSSFLRKIDSSHAIIFRSLVFERASPMTMGRGDASPDSAIFDCDYELQKRTPGRVLFLLCIRLTLAELFAFASRA